jgi:ABC-type glutathione transport system ATPase component
MIDQQVAPQATTTEEQTPLISLQNVDVSYVTHKGVFKRGEVRALTGVTLEIQRGETVALVGESGSGKSCSTARTSPRPRNMSLDGSANGPRSSSRIPFRA